jgi:hypothetical protein
MFNEAQNVAIVRTELDSVFYPEFNSHNDDGKEWDDIHARDHG